MSELVSECEIGLGGVQSWAPKLLLCWGQCSVADARVCEFVEQHA